MPKFLYQPYWREFTGFGDVPDYVDYRYSRRLFTSYDKALKYAKRWKKPGYLADVRKLEVMS